MRSISGEESERRWKTLTTRTSTFTSSYSGAPNHQDDDDPFDCSDLVVPTSQDLVNEATTSAIKQWKALEQRKVIPVDQPIKQPSRKRPPSGEKINWGWHAHRLRIPEFFDYATRAPHPPPDDGTGDRVVSLEDTSVHLSFEQELWNIFKSVPTVQELEAEALVGAQCPRMRVLHVEISEGIREHSRMDCHGLNRLRMADRHGLPCVKSGEYATMIRLECLRRQVKRGSSPDGCRLELEFLGTQTLQDVHDVLVELSKDDLWDDAKQTEEESQEVSGMFFIEGTFYTAGSVDYSTSILEWLDDEDPSPSRRAYLGLRENEPLRVKPMSSVILEELHWRMGMRYVHAHHGDVECSVFLTDIRYGLISPNMSYPIVHDIWSSSYSMIECEACRTRVGVLCASSSNERTDGGPRAVCEMCYKQLYPSGEAQSSACILKYSVWREQADLSLGLQEPGALFHDQR